MKIKILLFFLLTISCSDSSFNKELDEWKSKRYNALFAEDGYLNLAGLFLLESGNYTLGSSDSNDFVFPSDFPEKLGVLNIIDSVVSFEYLIEVNYKEKAPELSNYIAYKNALRTSKRSEIAGSLSIFDALKSASEIVDNRKIYY